MGQVFATAVASRGPLVIKVLHEALRNDPFFVNRLIAEARAARTVQHPNVVRVVDDGATEAGAPYLVMERVEGTPLGALIRVDGPMPLQRVRHIALQILAGISAIHRAGLVHGDVKSDNVLVDAHDHVTIIDFGLARQAIEGHTAVEDGMISGTPEYMAPEILAGAPLSTSSEIYSVGIIVYEMLTGTTPFAGGTSAEICVRHLTDDVVPPSLRAPDRAIPVPLETTIMRALAKDPRARHLTADLFAAAIACSIPATCHEVVAHAEPPQFSTTSPTKNWTRRNTSSVVDPDAVIVASLARTQQLLKEHAIEDARREVERALSWLRTNHAEARDAWRLLLTLAALRDRLGDREGAVSDAIEARDFARSYGIALGVDRANQLLRRFDTSSRRSRAGASR